MSKIVGQYHIINQVKKWVCGGEIPRFIILSGGVASGKTYIAKWIAKIISENVVEVENSVSDIRKMLDISRKVAVPTSYLIEENSSMSWAAKNSLLRFTEEPPRQAYVILTVNSINSFPETLKSRANVLNIAQYPKNLVEEYIDKKYPGNTLLKKYCISPAEVEFYSEMNLEILDEIIEGLLNIKKISGIEAFQFNTLIKNKRYDSEIGLGILLRKFNYILLDKMETEKISPVLGYKFMQVTVQYINKQRMSSVSQACLFDMWVLDLRDC